MITQDSTAEGRTARRWFRIRESLQGAAIGVFIGWFVVAIALTPGGWGKTNVVFAFLLGGSVGAFIGATAGALRSALLRRKR